MSVPLSACFFFFFHNFFFCNRPTFTPEIAYSLRMFPHHLNGLTSALSFLFSVWQARRDLNPQHPDLESDALPLELLACIPYLLYSHYISDNRARRLTPPSVAAGASSDRLLHPPAPTHGEGFKTAARLLRFLMHRMLSTEAAILRKFQFIRRGAFVFRRGIVATLALGARQGG